MPAASCARKTRSAPGKNARPGASSSGNSATGTGPFPPSRLREGNYAVTRRWGVIIPATQAAAHAPYRPFPAPATRHCRNHRHRRPCRLAPLAAARARRPGRALDRDLQSRRDRVEIERLADEGAERHHEIMRVHRPSGDQFAGGAFRQPDMLLGAEQDDVGQAQPRPRPDPPGTIRPGGMLGVPGPAPLSPEYRPGAGRAGGAGRRSGSPVNDPPSVL